MVLNLWGVTRWQLKYTDHLFWYTTICSGPLTSHTMRPRAPTMCTAVDNWKLITLQYPLVNHWAKLDQSQQYIVVAHLQS